MNSLLLVLFILALFFPANLAAATGPDEITQRLNDVARRELGSAFIEPESAKLLQEFIRRGAERLKAEGTTPENVKKASANLRRFVIDLKSFSEPTGGFDQASRIITSRSFAQARFSLCPLYPFC